MNQTLTVVPGVEVGHWTDPHHETGVTVVSFPEPNVAAVEIRGAAPGTRETALLQPGMRVEQIQALVFAGGSAFGLAAADGVTHALEQDGRGHPTPFGRVPIVPSAIIFDLHSGARRPGAPEGAAAYHARSRAPVAPGRVGAGAGATVGNWRGAEYVQPGGVGSAAVPVGEATVAALVILNAAGDVFGLEGAALSGGDHAPGPPGFEPWPLMQTTLVALATDASLERLDLLRLAVRSQDALAACIRPSHTRYDGDAAFAVSCGPLEADLDALGEAAYVATGRAIETAYVAAAGAGPNPTLHHG